MPRKYWTLKNRYCWNANLSESAFLCLLKLYCQERTATRAAKVMARFARRYGAEKVSRQTITRYHQLFGHYLYFMLPEEYQFLNVELDFGEGVDAKSLDDAYKMKLIPMALRQALYGKLAYTDIMNKALISNTTQDMHKRLVRASRSRNGIPTETFALHFTLQMGLLLMAKLHPGQQPSRSLFAELSSAMEESPIGSFYMPSIKLERAADPTT